MASELMPNLVLPTKFFEKPNIDIKKLDLNRKSQVDTELGESFYLSTIPGHVSHKTC